ncbi:MAG TPA: ferredoxin-NADPH reductase [Cellulomonas sp.]
MRTSILHRPSAETWQSLFGTGYVVVATNLMITVAAAPLVLLLTTTDPRRSWPALAIAAVLATPALAGAAGVFRAVTVDRSTDVVRTFSRTWRRQLRRSLALGAIACGGTVVIGSDLAAAAGTRLGAAVTPALLVIEALLVSTVLVSLVASVERPDARLRDVLRASLHLGVRRWYLTLASLGVLLLLAGLFTLHPAAALGLAAGPLLYAVWGNSRFTLRPVLGTV